MSGSEKSAFRRVLYEIVAELLGKGGRPGGLGDIPWGMLRPEPLKKAVARWRDHETRVLKHSEIEAKKGAQCVTTIARKLGWKTVADMTKASLVRYLRGYIAGRGPGAAKTARNHLARCRAFAAFLGETDQVSPEVFAGIRLPAARRRKGASAFTWDEVQRLIQHAREIEKTDGRSGHWGPLRSTFYAFLALTGLRYTEARTQRWEDINLERGYLTVTADKAKRGDPVRLNTECVAMLRRWRKWSRGDKVFAHTPSHHTLVKHMRACEIASVESGRKGQWHRFRKALCTQLAVQGVDPETRRRAMRHADTKITEAIYTDEEIVDNLAAPGEIIEKLPSVSDSSHLGLTKRLRIADDEVAEPMKYPSSNIVTEKNRACPGAHGLSNHRIRERGSSLSQSGCAQSNGAGGNRVPGPMAITLAEALDAQIRTLIALRASLN